MAWCYVDDHWDEHPKFLAAFSADPQAVVLFFSGLAYCRRSAPTGVIPKAKVRSLLGWRPKAVRALLECGLWDDADIAGVEIHDYDQWNRPAAGRTASARNAASAKWGTVSRRGSSRGSAETERRGKETRSQRLAAARELGTHTSAEWEALVAACGEECLRCREPFSPDNPRVKDHVVPIYQGGSDGIKNIQPLCRRCNAQKGSEAIDHRPAGVLP